MLDFYPRNDSIYIQFGSPRSEHIRSYFDNLPSPSPEPDLAEQDMQISEDEIEEESRIRLRKICQSKLEWRVIFKLKGNPKYNIQKNWVKNWIKDAAKIKGFKVERIQLEELVHFIVKFNSEKDAEKCWKKVHDIAKSFALCGAEITFSYESECKHFDPFVIYLKKSGQFLLEDKMDQITKIFHNKEFEFENGSDWMRYEFENLEEVKAQMVVVRSRGVQKQLKEIGLIAECDAYTKKLLEKHSNGKRKKRTRKSKRKSKRKRRKMKALAREK